MLHGRRPAIICTYSAFLVVYFKGLVFNHKEAQDKNMGLHKQQDLNIIPTNITYHTKNNPRKYPQYYQNIYLLSYHCTNQAGLQQCPPTACPSRQPEHTVSQGHF